MMLEGWMASDPGASYAAWIDVDLAALAPIIEWEQTPVSVRADRSVEMHTRCRRILPGKVTYSDSGA